MRRAFFFLGDVGRAAAPTGVDVEAFPVALPAGGGFVEAAAERQSVAGRVFEDAGFFVEQRRAGQRAPPRVAGHGHFDFQDALRHQPRQQFQRGGIGGQGGGERDGQQPVGDSVAQRQPAFDGGHFGSVEGAADDQPHVALVADQPFDAAQRQRQGVGGEIAGGAIVAHGAGQRGNVELRDQVAVVGVVFDAPGVVLQQVMHQ